MHSSPLLRSLPNLITLGRLLLVPLIVVVIIGQNWFEATLIFIAAGISDGVDGWIARRFSLRSELGAYLDPLADKALLVSIYVTLAAIGAVPFWLAILVVSRDIMIIGAVMVSWVMGRPVEIQPLRISKLNTAAQICFAAFILSSKALGFSPGPFYMMGMYVTAALTLASAGAYLVQWFVHMSE